MKNIQFKIEFYFNKLIYLFIKINFLSIGIEVIHSDNLRLSLT